jgi:hypothetical protein
MFLFLLVCFCFGVASSSGLSAIWLHIFHVPRGLTGMLLIWKHLPKSHDIIDMVDFEDMKKEDLNVERVSSLI